MQGVLQPKVESFGPRASVSPAAGVADFWPGVLLALAATCITIGIRWDISWHQTIGRDTFWTPAHLAIYLGGTLGGLVGGWLAIKYTFLTGPEGRLATVKIFGARAPLGAWVAIWGSVAMITSGPFDNWWHNAYGLDVKIISPPHALLAIGMGGVIMGALLLTLAQQNRLADGTSGGLFVWVGGTFVVLGAVFIMEYTFPNAQHQALFYEVCALSFPLRLVALGSAGRISWPVTRIAAVYLLLECLMVWILPLFPAQPKLAPIYNPVTHMVPPPFPLLMIVPAVALDLVLRSAGHVTGWKRMALALALGVIFLATFIPVQWFFAEFLISHRAENWFFAGNRIWDYGAQLGAWNFQFWASSTHFMRISSLAWCLGLAAVTSWLGLLLGGWMRKVQR